MALQWRPTSSVGFHGVCGTGCPLPSGGLSDIHLVKIPPLKIHLVNYLFINTLQCNFFASEELLAIRFNTHFL